jgi:glycogen operon protein
MLSGGDEISRTQQGNNNAYCQDSPLSWTDWSLDAERSQLFEFVCELTRLRAAHPVFRRRNFFRGRATPDGQVHDIRWLDPAGTEMTEAQWREGFARCLGVYLSGSALDERDERGQPITDNDFLLLLNAHHEPRTFTLPLSPASARWTLRIDTHLSSGKPSLEKTLTPGAILTLEGRSMMVFESPPVLAAPILQTVAKVLSKSTKRHRRKGPD